MLRLLPLLTTLCLAPAAMASEGGGVQETDLSSPAAEDVAAVTRASLEAIGRRDAQTAFQLSTPSMQLQTGSADVFLHMVRSEYPAVFAPKRWALGEQVDVHGMVGQVVDLVGPDGKPARALYLLLPVNGQWRVHGCVMLNGDEPLPSA